MYSFIKSAHSGLGIALLFILLLVIVSAALGWMAGKPYRKGGPLLGLAAVHLQLVIGIIIYFISPLGMANFSGAAMKDKISRLYILEHPLMMLIGIALITIGYSKAKRATKNQYKTITLFYLAGFILILSRIPWQVWF